MATYTPPNHIAEQIHHARRSAGLTRDELAAASGVGQRTVQRIERIGTANLRSLMELADALNTPNVILPNGDRLTSGE